MSVRGSLFFRPTRDGWSSTLLSQIGRLINNEIMPSTSCWLLDLLKRPRYDHDFSVVTSPRPRHEQRARVLRKNEGKTHALAWTGRPCLVRSSPASTLSCHGTRRAAHPHVIRRSRTCTTGLTTVVKEATRYGLRPVPYRTRYPPRLHRVGTMLWRIDREISVTKHSPCKR
jgi:hypothetical protein